MGKIKETNLKPEYEREIKMKKEQNLNNNKKKSEKRIR